MSLQINKAIFNILSSDEKVVALVGDKMFPVAADDDAKSPFIVYTRKSVLPCYSKDGLEYDECIVEVACASDDYEESITIAQSVRKAMELKVGVFEGVAILQSRFLNCTEGWGVDNNIQTVNFQMMTQDIILD